MSNINEKLRELYAALGGEPADVANLTTHTEILNAVSVFMGGSGSAGTISDAVTNIIPVVPAGGGEWETMLAGVIDGSVTRLVIPEGTTRIRNNLFSSCTGLTNVTIGNGVTSIGNSAFSDCTGLETITINKPENSISGAPWGATNATVVWTG